MRVLGVDGDKRGWLGIVLAEGRFESAHLDATLDHLTRDAGPVDAIAVDMPIGLVDGPRREADQAARRLLPGKASSVFNAPPACVWDTANYEEANRICRAEVGQGLSRQSWGLMTKIREATGFQARSAAQVVEAHPELAFAHMGGMRPVAESKQSWSGQRQRIARLASVGVTVPDELGDAGSGGAADVLDAAAVAHVARRVASGEALCVPDPPETATIGNDIAVWY